MTENKRFENKYTANYMNNKIVSVYNPKGESLNIEQMIVELNKLSDAIKNRRIKDEKLKSVNIEYENAFARLEQRNKRLEEKIQRERFRKEVENKIKELSEENEQLKKENENLKQTIEKLCKAW